MGQQFYEFNIKLEISLKEMKALRRENVIIRVKLKIKG